MRVRARRAGRGVQDGRFGWGVSGVWCALCACDLDVGWQRRRFSDDNFRNLHDCERKFNVWERMIAMTLLFMKSCSI